ncbi:MAG: hypothetical protein RLZZ31_1739 [Actinomycetota bacterium]
MALHLVVGESLDVLVQQLAEQLSAPHNGDVFASDLIIVPGAGVRAWTTTQLAHHLGAQEGHGGVAANLRFGFPSQVFVGAFGDNEIDKWKTGPLTWIIFDELFVNGSAYGEQQGEQTDAIRARAIADLFDRYLMYRPAMLRNWSEGRDVGPFGPLDENLLWQPQLWRAITKKRQAKSGTDVLFDFIETTKQLGAQTNQQASLFDNHEIPERVFLFGLASLPPAHLSVLAALSYQREIYIYAPTPSAIRWQKITEALQKQGPLALPVARQSDVFPDPIGHPLGRLWGRAMHEANGLLVDAAFGTGLSSSTLKVVEQKTENETSTLLSTLQKGIRADLPLEQCPTIELAPNDKSMQFHRCYGVARQIQVARDCALHALAEKQNGKPIYSPRDIAIITPDIQSIAPLAVATFAGDPEHGLPAVPLEIADRTLRQENFLVDALLQLFEFTERRFRASEVVKFLSQQVVRQKFSFSDSDLAVISTWIDQLSVKWGIDEEDLNRFGIGPSVSMHTFQKAVQRLFLGAALPDNDQSLGLANTPPEPGIEGELVDVVGRFSEFLLQLSLCVDDLCVNGTVHQWCEAVRMAISRLFLLDNDQAWMSRSIDDALRQLQLDALDAVTDEAARGRDEPNRFVPPADLASLVRTRLEASSSRPRFGTGAVTLSSLTALRGLPFKIVIVVGLDSDVASISSAEDLVSAFRCVGDRDQRSEQRAQLLDAVLSAQDRLIILSNGRDVRTNAKLPPTVALAELHDVVNAIAQSPTSTSAVESCTVMHPRQGWSERAFLPNELGVEGPWSFDKGAFAAAEAQRNPAKPDQANGAEQWQFPFAEGESAERVSLEDLIVAVTQPVRLFQSRRLEVSGDSEFGLVFSDVVDLDVNSLAKWQLSQQLLQKQIAPHYEPEQFTQWEKVKRARGDVPPGQLGTAIIETVENEVRVLAALAKPFTENQTQTSLVVSVFLPSTEKIISGSIANLYGNTLLSCSPSRVGPKDQLSQWVQLAALTIAFPETKWRAVTIGLAPDNDGKGDYCQRVFSLPDRDAAERVLLFAYSVFQTALQTPIPLFPKTSLARFQKKAAGQKWADYKGNGERSDRWNRLFFDLSFSDLTKLPTIPLDNAPAGSRLDWWADHLWSTVEQTMSITSDELLSDAGQGDSR